MNLVRPIRGVLVLALAVTCLLAGLSAPDRSAGDRSAPELAPAADTSAFRPGNIISNSVFYDSRAMGSAQIQSFLNSKGSSCRPAAGGPACLKDYVLATPTRAADAYCQGRYNGAARETAAQVIAKVGLACGINPRVLLVTLQKEMTLVTRSAPTAKHYTRAMGFGCPDSANGGCDSTYNGLFNQLYTASKQFKRYAAKPTGYGHVAGLMNTVMWNPNPACGTSRVYIENQATASLYNYTPYRPNAAALAAGYGGSKDSCSSYGNRNFWMWFTDWFGSTQITGRDVDAPLGTLDQVGVGPSSISLRGWTFDPNAPTTSINVHTYVDGRFFGALTANASRPDIGSVYPDVGSAHGFSGSVAAAPGKHAVCVYTVNVGPGYTNPLLGCRTVTVAGFPPHNAVGGLDPVVVSALSVAISGWAVDPDALASPARVHVYVDGRPVTGLTADQPRDDVLRAYPAAGAGHGFTFSGPLPAGSHQICAYALNIGAGTANPSVGCRTVVLGGPPVGALEMVTAAPAQVRMLGWAIDPDTVDPVGVHVYVNGAFTSAVVADATRADIETARPGYGTAHGFDVTLPVAAGQSHVCAYAINAGSGGRNTSLGCIDVAVPATAFLPIGNVDGAVAGTGTVTSNGWALDKDVPTEAVQVHVYIDGVLRQSVTANALRTDIGAAYPGAGNYHGWTTTALSVASGTHEVCAYGINRAGGSSNPKMACKSVVVP